MVQIGMHVDAVEEAGRQLNSCASAIDGVRDGLDVVIRQLSLVWKGSDARAFLDAEWPRHRKALGSVRVAIGGLARDARQNARQQRDASAAQSGGTPVWADSAITGNRPGPSDVTQTFIDNLRVMKGNAGYRIQEVMGSDGKVRFILYINGTGSAKDLTLTNNVDEMAKSDNAAQERIAAALAAATKGHPGAAVMIVGYSQGGMIAQNIADTGRFHVTEVLAYGSPKVAAVRNFNGANVTYLRNRDDFVPDLSPFKSSIQSTGDYIAGVAQHGLPAAGGQVHEFDFGNGHGVFGTTTGALSADVLDGVGRSLAAGAVGLFTLGKADAVGQQIMDGSLTARGIAAHEDPQTYNAVASAFNESTEPWAISARQRMDAFAGPVIQDTNVSGVADWQPSHDMAVPGF